VGNQPIDIAAKIFFQVTQDLDSEVMVYGFAITHREATDWGALIDAMETAWVDNVGGIAPRGHLTRVVYSEWATTGFTGWHQRQAKIVSHAGSSGNALPPQDAVVVTLLNVDDTGLPIRSRRGRVYFGLVPQSFIDGDGVLNSTALGGYADAIQGFQDAANSVPASTTGAVLTDGLCVASPTQGKVFNAQDYGVGKVVDTQRRRRQKRPEAITYTAFT